MDKIKIISAHTYAEDVDRVDIVGAYTDDEKLKADFPSIMEMAKKTFYDVASDSEEDTDTEESVGVNYYHIWSNYDFVGVEIKCTEIPLNTIDLSFYVACL